MTDYLYPYKYDNEETCPVCGEVYDKVWNEWCPVCGPDFEI